MPTMKKDFKNLVLPDPQDSFENGFIMALVLMAGMLKMFGVIA